MSGRKDRAVPTRGSLGRAVPTRGSLNRAVPTRGGAARVVIRSREQDLVDLDDFEDFDEAMQRALYEGTPDSVRTLRRPITNDSSHFWYISETHWNGLINETKESSKAKAALNQLRKFDHAGRIMETDEGKAAPHPCSFCTRPGNTVNCRVWRDQDGKVCAQCIRQGRGNCTAKTGVEETTMDRLARLEGEITGLKSDVTSLAVQGARRDARIAQLEQNVHDMDNDTASQLAERLMHLSDSDTE